MNTSFFAMTLTLALNSVCSAQTSGIECAAEQVLHQQQLDDPRGPISSDGSIVAIAHGSDMDIELYDTADPSNPVLLSTIPGLGFSDSTSTLLAMSSDRLVAYNRWWDVLQVVDISTPTNPIPGDIIFVDIRSIEISGNSLIVHSRTDSIMTVYDMADPANLQFMDSVFGANDFEGMDVSGDTVCVADHNDGLRLYDISDPTNITQVALFPSDDTARGVSVRGDIVALMTAFPKPIIFVDISDPFNPVEIVSTGINVVTSNATFVGDKFLIPQFTGVRVYDISSIADPHFDGILTGPDVLSNQNITSTGSDLAMTSGEFFSINDLSKSDAMNSEVYNDTPSGIASNSNLRGVFVDENYAFTYDQVSESLVVLDVSDPANPTQAASLFVGTNIQYPDLEYTMPIDYADGVVYIGLGGPQIAAIDVSNPLSPALINSWAVDNGSIALAHEGDYLYSLTYQHISVFDVSVLTSPTLVATAPTSGSFDETIQMIVEGDRLAYVKYSEGGGLSQNYLYVMDISDPLNPIALDNASNNMPDYFAGGLEIEGNTLYATLGGYYHNGPSIYNGALASYDISDVVELLDVIRFESLDPDVDDGGKLGQILLDDDKAYVVSRYIGGSTTNQSISLFDIQDPSNIAFKGATGTATRLPSGFATKTDDLIYMVGGFTTGSGMAIFDASSCAGCPADLSGDGSLNFFDVSAFLGAFAAQDPIADFTGDGSWDFFDVSAFLNAFNAGCP